MKQELVHIPYVSEETITYGFNALALLLKKGWSVVHVAVLPEGPTTEASQTYIMEPPLGQRRKLHFSSKS